MKRLSSLFVVALLATTFTAVNRPAVAAEMAPGFAFVSGPIASDVDGAYFTERHLFVGDPNGNNVRQLTTNLAVGEIDWSPDGQRLVFTSGFSNLGSGAYEVWTINYDGTGLTRIASGPEFNSEPAWSPKGDTIAFTRGSRIWLINPDGTNLRRLTTEEVDEDSASFSADGSLISYIPKRRLTSVWARTLDGRTQASLTRPSDRGDVYDSEWSRDGTKLIHEIRSTSGGYDYSEKVNLYRSNGSGSRPGAWANGNGRFNPRPSADGGCVTLNITGEATSVIRCGVMQWNYPVRAYNLVWRPSAPALIDPTVVDSFVVGGDSITQWSAGGLIPGQRYEIVAKGTYTYGPLDASADAECSDGANFDNTYLAKRYPKQSWTNPLDLSEDPLDLLVGGHQHDDWVVNDPDTFGCSISHTYRLPFTAPDSASIPFRIADVEASDNHGVIFVQIRRL